MRFLRCTRHLLLALPLLFGCQPNHKVVNLTETTPLYYHIPKTLSLSNSYDISPEDLKTLDWQLWDPEENIDLSKQGDPVILFKFDIPPITAKNSSISFRECNFVFDLIYGGNSLGKKAIYNPKKMYLIETSHYLSFWSLPISQQSKQVFLKTIVRDDNKSSAQCEEIILSTQERILFDRLFIDLYQGIIGFLMIVASVITLGIWIAFREIKTLIFTLFCLTTGFTFLGNLQIVWFLSGKGSQWWGLWYLSAFTFPTFLISYMGYNNSRFLKWYFILTIPNIILTLNHLYLWFFTDGYNPSILDSNFINILLIQASILFIPSAIQIKKDRGYERIIAALYCGLCLLTIYDGIGLTFDPEFPILTPLGLLSLIGTQLFINILQQRDRIESLEAHKRQKVELAKERLEKEVNIRTQDLKKQKEHLSDVNQELSHSYNLLKTTNVQLQDSNAKNSVLIEKISYFDNHSLSNLSKLISELPKDIIAKDKLIHEISQIKNTLMPITNSYQSELNISNRKVIHVAKEKSELRLFRVSLGGIKINLIQTDDAEHCKQLLRSEDYDLLILGFEFFEIADFCNEFSPNTQIILMTSEEFAKHIGKLIGQNYISNVIFTDSIDPTFSMRTMASTIAKIMNSDYFGITKYVSWGTRIKEIAITNSNSRHDILEFIGRELGDTGIRKSVISRAALIADEMLMNAIYDAPTTADGKSKYNHLPRTELIELKAHEHGRFKFASDGTVLAISVEDPFGSLTKETLFNYVQTCYDGEYGVINEEQGKAGGGMGLFQILTASDLVVVNVKKGIRTEVIALLNIASKAKTTRHSIALHFFNL